MKRVSTTLNMLLLKLSQSIFTNKIVHKKIIDDQCIFDVYFYMLTYSSSAFFVKGATAKRPISSAFGRERATVMLDIDIKKYIDHQLSFCVQSDLSIGTLTGWFKIR